MCRALEQQTDTAFEKLVLVILEQESKTSRIGVFPIEQKEVAKTACCSVNTVRRALKTLAQKNLIVVTQKPGKVPFYSICY